MPLFTVNLQRTETYLAEIKVEAETQQAAELLTEAKLDEGGWDSACDADGDYDTCDSMVIPKDRPANAAIWTTVQDAPAPKPITCTTDTPTAVDDRPHYCVCVVAHRPGPDGCSTRTTIGVLAATSRDEALGKATRIGLGRNPPADGWRGHAVSVCSTTDVTSDARVEELCIPDS